MSQYNTDYHIPYDVLSVMAENDKTKVCLASSPISKEPIVVKIAKNVDIELIKKIAEIPSPYLAQILHIEDDGVIFEEYIKGSTLDEYIRLHASGEEEIVELILQVCEGLRTLHSQTPPIIHRDLKPSNILVQETDSFPVVKIIDFDASREYKPDQPHDTRALGTDTYAPPEQYGYSQTDVRSDIYSLGSVIDEVTKERDITPELRAIITKATMFNPDQRYQSIGELASALRTYRIKRIRKFPLIVTAVSLCILIVVSFLLVKIGDKPLAETDSESVPTQILDTINPETGASVPWVFYYLTKNPGQSPLALSTMSSHGEPRDVRISSESDAHGREIDAEFWHEDEDGFIHIDDAFLSTLDKNVRYTVSVDFTDVFLVFDLMCIDDLSMVKLGTPALNPGYTEYIRTESKDIVFHLANTFGRGLKTLKNMDTGEVLGEEQYRYDKQAGTIVLYKSYFESFHDGDYVNIAYEFEENPAIKSVTPSDPDAVPAVTICVRDEPYIAPVVRQKSIVIGAKDEADITLDIEFNSAEGKLEDIFLTDKNRAADKPVTLAASDYEVTENGVLLKGTWLRGLAAGEYELMLEFGDVGRRIQLTVTG